MRPVSAPILGTTTGLVGLVSMAQGEHPHVLPENQLTSITNPWHLRRSPRDLLPPRRLRPQPHPCPFPPFFPFPDHLDRHPYLHRRQRRRRHPRPQKAPERRYRYKCRRRHPPDDLPPQQPHQPRPPARAQRLRGGWVVRGLAVQAGRGYGCRGVCVAL